MSKEAEWILSDDKERCPNCQAIIDRYKRAIKDKPVDWLNIIVLDDFMRFGSDVKPISFIEVGQNCAGTEVE